MTLGDNLSKMKDYEDSRLYGAAQNAVQTPYYGDQCTTAESRPTTLREEAEKQIGYHREQADKLDRAAAFLRDNPAFDEFVRLVRAGVIQF
jgi:hypothetical protein